MPTDCDRLRDDSLCPSLNHVQPFFTSRVPLASSTSPVASQQELLPFHASHISPRGQTYTTSPPAAHSPEFYTFNAADPSLTSEFDHLPDDCGGAALYPPGLDHSWSPPGDAYESSFDMTLYSSHAASLNLPKAHLDDPLGSWSTGTSPQTMSSSCYLPPWHSSHSVPDGTYGQDSSYWGSPVSPYVVPQSMHGFCREPSSPFTIAIQPGYGQVPDFPAYDEDLVGSLGESVYAADPPATHATNHSWDTEFKVHMPLMQTASAPGLGPAGTTDTNSRSTCSLCQRKFSHSADLTRHTKTQHGEAGKGYRCAFAGCSKVHKVWSRLDSFKKHVRKQHQIEDAADINSLVDKSATGEHGLPIAMTSLSRAHAGSSASRIRHSVTL